MSTPSLLLSCAGAAASLAGVWTLAGLSERSALRVSPRAFVATGVGMVAEAAAYFTAPPALRAELALPLLFATAGVLALGAGTAKIEAALAVKDGSRAVRRASGIVAGSFFAMAAVGAASLDLGQSSLLHARLGWALMFSLVASSLVVFVQRTRYAGAGLMELGHRAWLLGLIVVALLVGAGLTRASSVRAEVIQPPPAPLPALPAAPAAPPSAFEPVAPDPPAAPAASLPAVSPGIAAAPAAPARVVIETMNVHGLMDADAQGGVARRMERLGACLTEQNQQQRGTLTVKVSIDAIGSVADSRALSGDLATTPLGACLASAFYKMGFAAPKSGSAGFEVTLRVGEPEVRP